MQRTRAQKILILSLCLTLVLTACGSKAELPETYEMDTLSLKSLTAVLGEGEKGAVLAAEKTPDAETPGTDAKALAADGSTAEIVYDYSYKKLTSGGTNADAYAAYLASDEKFRSVDADGSAADRPDYTAETGEAYLRRTTDDGKTDVTAHLSWEKAACEITFTCTPADDSDASANMTNGDAISYFETLDPTMLGLSGSSMDEYAIYPMDSVAEVDGTPCLKVQIYRNHQPENSNLPVGTYLYTSDRHIYRVDGKNAAVELTVR